jgi:hypothetical protein
MDLTRGIGIYTLTIGMRMLFQPLAILCGGIGVTAQWVWAGVAIMEDIGGGITEDTVITPAIMEVATATEAVIGDTILTTLRIIAMAEGILPDIGQETYIITIASLLTLQTEQVAVQCHPPAGRQLMEAVA